MSPELIGIIVVGIAIAAAAFYYLHTTAGAAQAASLAATAKTDLAMAVADLKGHISTTAAANAPTPAPVAPQPIEIHLVQPPSPAPVAAPVAPPSQPVGLTPQQSSNLLLYGNIMGPSQGQAGSGSIGVAPVAPTDTPATRPPYPSYWQLDMLNGSSATSAPFTLPAGSYRVDATDGFANGQCAASITGVGAVSPGATFTVPAPLATNMLAVAVPGNPNSTSVRFGAQINKTA